MDDRDRRGSEAFERTGCEEAGSNAARGLSPAGVIQ